MWYMNTDANGSALFPDRYIYYSDAGHNFIATLEVNDGNLSTGAAPTTTALTGLSL